MRFIVLALLVFGSTAHATEFGTYTVPGIDGLSQIVISQTRNPGLIQITEIGADENKIGSQYVNRDDLESADANGVEGLRLNHVATGGYTLRLIECNPGSKLESCYAGVSETYYLIDVRDECTGSSVTLERQ